MNNHPASTYNSYHQHHDVTTGTIFQNGTTGLSAPPANVGITQPPFSNPFVVGQMNMDGFYHSQGQHVPLVYHQAMDAQTVTPNHLIWSHQQSSSQQRYLLPSFVPPTPSYLTSTPFGVGGYTTGANPAEQLTPIKQQPQQTYWKTQAPSAVSLFSVFNPQPQTSLDNYVSATAQPSTPAISDINNPLAGLRALSDHYTRQGGIQRDGKSPSRSLSSTNTDYSQKRTAIDPAKTIIPNVGSPAANCRISGIGSPQQSFIPPSPILKSSSHTTRSSPLSTSTTYSGHGSANCIVNSPATPRGPSVSSVGSIEPHIDPVTTAPTGGSVDMAPAVVGGSFPSPFAPYMHQHQQQQYDDSLVQPSSMASFYAQNIDPAASLMDPTTAAMFGQQVVGSDPSLHSAVDDAFSALSRDVNLGDLADINCANMMVGHNFWDDLGDAVLDDPLLSTHGSAVCSTSSVDLVNSNHIGGNLPGAGGLLHSVLEFGIPSCENGHTATGAMNVDRLQAGATKRVSSNDLNGPVPVCSTSTTSLHSVQGDVKVATPKLREKMKRKAQGENELAEIDRAFARHLSMVAERNEGQSTSAPCKENTTVSVEELDLDALTADTCLRNRMKRKSSKTENGPDEQVNSPVGFVQPSTDTSVDVALEQAKKNIRKIMYADRKARETKPVTKAVPTSGDASTSLTKKSTVKSTKQPSKVPIYKQVSTEKTASDQRRNSDGGDRNISTDSPYNFTDDDETIGPANDQKETSSHPSDDPSGVTDQKQKNLDAEVTRKLLQISTLHPELKMSPFEGEREKYAADDHGLRHVVPKKRQQWQMAANDALRGQRHFGFHPPDGAINAKSAASSGSIFVKTEIITDDTTTAMPSYSVPMNSSAVMKVESPDDGSVRGKVLLPKLIIRIPRKCLEQAPRAPVNVGSDDTGEMGKDEHRHHHHHSHKKRKREKRGRRDSTQGDQQDMVEDTGDIGRHKKHRGRNANECVDERKPNCLEMALTENERHTRMTSENYASEDYSGCNKAIDSWTGLHKKSRKREIGGSGEWDHLPFKLRKKLQRCPQTVATEEEIARLPMTKCTDSSSANNSAYVRSLMDDRDQSVVLDNENKDLESLRLRFSNGPVFQKGAFVVCKDDIGKQECPIWKVDSQNLLQKFAPIDRQGRLVYMSTSTFAGWCIQNQDLYATVPARYVTQSRSECVVELESPLEEQFPAVSTELTEERQRNGTHSVSRSSRPPSIGSDSTCEFLDHPQAEALMVYVNVLLLHALLGNCLQAIQRNNNAINGDWVSRIKKVDLVNAEKCKTLLSFITWQELFKESLEWYSHCTVSEDEGFGLQCQACGNATTCNVLQLFANEGYDFETLEARPPRTTGSGSPLPSQDYHLCSSCAAIAMRYHTLFHMRYHLFRKCEDAVELVRDGNPMLAVGAVVDVCMQNKKWLSTTVNEYLQLWSTVQ